MRSSSVASAEKVAPVIDEGTWRTRHIPMSSRSTRRAAQKGLVRTHRDGAGADRGEDVGARGLRILLDASFEVLDRHTRDDDAAVFRNQVQVVLIL
jgi:hypothetical protein